MNVRKAFSCSALGALFIAAEALAHAPTNVNLTCGTGVNACTGLGTAASPFVNTTNTFNCARTQTFVASATGTGTKIWELTIASPSGYTATTGPAITSSAASVSISRTLSRVSTTARCDAKTVGTGVWSVTVSVRFSGDPTSGHSATKQVFYRTRDATPPNALPTRFCACDNATCINNPAVASDNCDLAPTETFVSQAPDVPVAPFCAGNYNRIKTWTTADCNLNSINRAQTTQVRDFVGPVVTPNLSEVACLWPPNHEMVFFANAAFPIVATDNCSGVAARTLVGCISSQPDELPGEVGPTEECSGDGNTGPDCESVVGGLNIRSERCGDATHPDEGRDYSVRGNARDTCGNTGAAQTVGVVSVPHDEDDQTLTECISAE